MGREGARINGGFVVFVASLVFVAGSAPGDPTGVLCFRVPTCHQGSTLGTLMLAGGSPVLVLS